MASQTHPYTYVKPAQLATRSIVSDAKPSATTTSASTSHKAADAQGKANLASPTTDNYERAAAAAATVQNKSAEGAGVLSGTDRPGLDRTKSWKMQDKRRDHMEGVLSGQPSGMGYSSTGGQ
ncbi:hypothetical protein LTR78_009277 [Recurvomyces mirabilis]|uniref:Uncharacterized protein n=1 Tax=Recurvomyces mirabilis TaxID=574656 RepID=A0AAE0TSL6_9PEZI|nr:hypothetical protein LTR78_009277 [Recurvomyces mirabilis]KAK5156162.1 hypothetical protein LTS14_005049 [Recurvomyces mirabilis]